MTDYRALPVENLYHLRESRAASLLAALEGETRELAVEVLELWRESNDRLALWAAWQRFAHSEPRRRVEERDEQMELSL